jgi:adenosylmethionine-8-amino-7-oxononanoate aminotransferase
MSTPSWAERDRRVTWHPFTQMQEWCAGTPLVIERGDGNYLVDVDGRRYLDGVASLWCNVHGHRHPALDAALVAQVGRLAHSTFLGLSHPPGIELSERLVAIAPPGLARVFFSDSGSAAVEIALKLAFQYQRLIGQGGRTTFLHLAQGYHGDTLGAVGVGGIEVFHRVFGPLIVPGVPISPPYRRRGADDAAVLAAALAELDRVLEARGPELAAFVVEPLIQGAAGMLTHVPGYLREAAARCKAHGVLLIVDEVATGFGRTGTMFACEQEGVTPDLLCVAKGLTGGYLPLAATLATDAIYQAFLGERRDGKHFFHGHTFTANPLACAVALASLDLLQGGVLGGVPAKARRLGALLASEIVPLAGVAEVRQVGMMVGIELRDQDPLAGVAVCDRVREHGVILRPLGNVVVWMPPLSLTEEDSFLLASATRASLL